MTKAACFMIDLYTTPTTNGLKASVMLEEGGLPYRVHKVGRLKGEHLQQAYLAINPVGRIPAIVDRDIGGGPMTACSMVAVHEQQLGTIRFSSLQVTPAQSSMCSAIRWPPRR
jgi:hypothetical protein